MFEVELRGNVPGSIDLMASKFKSIGAKFVERRKRFSMIYFKKSFGERGINDSLDLRLRVSNGKSEIVLKYGKPSAFDNRLEISLPINTKNFGDAVEILKLLGWYKGVITVTYSYKFIYKGIEFVFVDAGLRNEAYFEAESLSKNRQNIYKKRVYIEKVCSQVGFSAFDEKGYKNLLKRINTLPGRKFDLNKQSFSSIRRKFINYF